MRPDDEVPEEKFTEIAEAARVEIELGRSPADVRQMVAQSLLYMLNRMSSCLISSS